MVSMAESVAIPSSRKTHNPHHLQQKKKKKDLNYSDMAAAQQLMQLSDEENSNSNSNNSKVDMTDDEEVFDQRLLMMMKKNNNVHVNIMEEIFGKDDVVFCRAKKRRYRSLADIYMEPTKKVFRSSSTQN